MANVYGHLQWKLDTGGTITADKIRIKKMEWLPNAAGDDLLIVDNAAEDIWRITNALAGALPGKESIDFGDKGFDARGFVLTIGGGTLYVWII